MKKKSSKRLVEHRHITIREFSGPVVVTHLGRTFKGEKLIMRTEEKELRPPEKSTSHQGRP